MLLFSTTTIEVPALAPDSSGFHCPLPDIQGDNRKAGVNMIAHYASIPAPVNPVVLFPSG